jgi:hypothetical protein
MESENAFTAPVVQIWVKEPARGGVFEDVTIRLLGDRYFIVGRLADPGDEIRVGSEGLLYWHALDEVIRVVEFPSLEAARNCYKLRADYERQNQTHQKTKRWWQH